MGRKSNVQFACFRRTKVLLASVASAEGHSCQQDKDIMYGNEEPNEELSRQIPDGLRAPLTLEWSSQLSFFANDTALKNTPQSKHAEARREPRSSTENLFSN